MKYDVQNNSIVITWLNEKSANEKSAQLDFTFSDKYHKYAATQAKQSKTVYEYLSQDYITIQANWPSFGVDSIRIKKVPLQY